MATCSMLNGSGTQASEGLRSNGSSSVCAIALAAGVRLQILWRGEPMLDDPVGWWAWCRRGCFCVQQDTFHAIVLL